MTTIQNIVTIVLISFLMISGVSLIGSQAFINGNLDEESVNILKEYDTSLSDFNETFYVEYEMAKTLPDYEPDANLVDEFVKEYSETKDTVRQLRDILGMVFNLPEILIMSIPFVDDVDLGIYNAVIWFALTLSVTFAIFNAIRNRRVTD